MGRLIDLDKVEFLKVDKNIEFNHGVDCCINRLLEQPIIEAIPKDQYEARLKADMVALLSELKDEIKYCEVTGLWKANYREGFNDGVSKSLDAIQQKINKLKEQTNG